MNTDWTRQRRNLVAVSIALTIFWGADGRLDESIVIGQAARLDNPVTLVVIAIFVWLYLLWRYWLYSKEYHTDVGKAVDARFQAMECYRNLVDRHDTQFRNNSGVSHSEGFQKAAIEDDPETEFIPIPTSISITRGLRTHTLNISVDNPEGEYNPDTHQVEIPAFEYERCRFCAFFRSFISDRIASDIVIPYTVGILPLIAWVLSQFFV